MEKPFAIEAGQVPVQSGRSYASLALNIPEPRLWWPNGSGDFINDDEGLNLHERFRPDLVLAYFPQLDRKSGAMRRLEMIPRTRYSSLKGRAS